MKRTILYLVVLTVSILSDSVSAQNTINSNKVSTHLQEMVTHSATKGGYKSVSSLSTLPAPFSCRLIRALAWWRP